MPTETMTPKERWLATLQRRPVDRAPMDYWATAEATQKLLAHLGVDNERQMNERLHIDRVISVAPTYVCPPIPQDHDLFGCRHQRVDYGTGVY